MDPSYPYTPESIRSNLRTLIMGRRVELLQQVGSTNDIAREAGQRGEPEGLVVLAEEQIAGRGRLGRAWTAPPASSILCSVLLRPRFSPEQAFYLTIAASLAIYTAVKEALKPPESQVRSMPLMTARHKAGRPKSKFPAIKWPNDVLIGGRKVAGVLSESEFNGGEWAFAVVGFGINVQIDTGQLGNLRSIATSLSAELGHPVDRTQLLARVLEEFEGLYIALQNGQFGHVRSRWVAALETVGKRVSVREPSGTISGLALRVDPDGALVIRTDGAEERRVLAGDVQSAVRDEGGDARPC